MFKRTVVLLAAGAAAALLPTSATLACEAIHLKRLKTVEAPPPPGSEAVCWTGCPLQIQGEQDSGKGRWLIRKGDGVNFIDAVSVVEKNLNSGQVFYMTTARTDRVCPDHPEVVAAIAAGATDIASLGCTTPDFKVKYTEPKVCTDQTLNCAPEAQKSLVVLHSWNDVDDLGRGVDIVLNIPGAGPTTFSHSQQSRYSVFFEDCCGTLSDFGAPGDPFALRTFAVIRTPAGDCMFKEMNTNQGDELPDPSVPDEDCQ